MKIETAQEAIETYKLFDDWQYADREAAWKWMFEQGWNAALEKAAETAYECLDDPYLSGHGYATNIAAAIRALKEG